MTQPMGIRDRFYEVAATASAIDAQREVEGWMVIKDRATGRALIVMANTREAALWLLKAINLADKTADRMEVT